MRKGTSFAAISAVVTGLVAAPAHGFSTRVHVALANAVREAAIDGDGRIALRGSPYAVTLPEADFAAIRDYPLAFRAGAIGPDNMVFPGMTDPSHAIGRRPYEQCEALYAAAATGAERAYALGCFLHGATDAVAHHFVNYFTGETFTLNPITAERAFALDNVVRHIVVESMIQRALFEAAPDDFDQGSLLHDIPDGFLLRTYLDPEATVWQMAAEDAYAAFEAARADAPDAPLPVLVAGLDIGPADHLLLAPVYIAEAEAAVEAARADVEARIAELQDPGTPDGATLGVGPGQDGVLGTKDDETACSASCPTLYATYFVYVGLLAPRYDAMNNELPSAFDKIADKLRDDLAAFGPAYVDTVGNLSARLNEPLLGGEGGFDLEPWEVEMLAAPLLEWSDQLTTIDYDTLLFAILPDWAIEMQMLLQQAGVSVQLAGIVEAVVQPIVAPIEQAIREQFLDRATMFLMDLADQIAADESAIESEVRSLADALASPDLPGPWFDHVAEAGLVAHAFNLTAVTLADHRMILPPPGLDGPATFDASHTPAWTQPGACDYLRDAVFPYGLDAAALLTVERDGTVHPAGPAESPVECHDGDLGAFADDPSPAVCGLVALAELLETKVGSTSRSYPPAVSPTATACLGIEVPGLPAPPDDPGGTGGTSGTAGGSTGGDDAGATAGTDGTAGTGGDAGAGGGDGGCGCSAGSTPGAAGTPLLALLGLSGLVRRRRRRGRRGRRSLASAAALGLFLGLAGCGGDDGDDGGDGGTQGTTGTAGSSGGTSGASMTGTGSDATGPGTAGTDATDGTAGSTGTTGGDDGLLEALHGTTWHGVFVREGVERAYEIAFDTESMLWSEIRNPYGPARLREMRSFSRDEAGLFHTIVVSPRGWPVHPENGRMDTWEIELVEGPPRQLRVTRDGVTEVFDEGPFPAPEDGMTAVVRVFKSGGTVDAAFCNSGGNGFDYKAILDFANGKSDEIVAEDVVAGVQFLPWTDPTMNNQFSVTDLDGFDRYGGTELSDSFNFVVTYLGGLDHPGGTLGMREADDAVEDALWVFLGDAVGSDDPADLFLEVHGFVWPDGTPDEPTTVLPPGDVPVQAIAVRCTEPITDVEPEVWFEGTGWIPFDAAPWTPVIDEALFPPAL